MIVEVKILDLGLWVGGERVLARKLCWDEAMDIFDKLILMSFFKGCVLAFFLCKNWSF